MTWSRCTFEDVERLWDTVVRPVLRDFRAMQDLWEGEPPLGTLSGMKTGRYLRADIERIGRTSYHHPVQSEQQEDMQ